jgi:glucose/mannose transport system permease protein
MADAVAKPRPRDAGAGRAGAAPIATSPVTGRGASWRRGLERHAAKLALTPSLLIVFVFVYGFILWTTYISFTSSGLVPRYELTGLGQYVKLWSSDRWLQALRNLGLFTGLFIGACLAIGVALAVLLDQKIRAEGFLRTIFLYPMALSFIVTGTAWKWILNPGLGLESFAHRLGFAGFTFDWLVNPERSIYTVVIAAVWQSSGFVMALMLAGLRGIDGDIMRAAQVDGASLPVTYRRIVLPALRPVFLSTFIILAHISIKTFDLVIALTGGGPGYASDMPATYMYTQTFQRNQLGVGAASAVMMLMGVTAVIVPYLYSELRTKPHD